jgi:hypothetical protein
LISVIGEWALRYVIPFIPVMCSGLIKDFKNKSGIVKWSITDRDSYRAGIKFIK